MSQLAKKSIALFPNQAISLDTILLRTVLYSIVHLRSDLASMY